MSSQLASRLYTDLLANAYTASTLNTELTADTYAGAFAEVCNNYGYSQVLVNSTIALPTILGSANARAIATNSPAFLRACANSAYATEQLVTTADGAVFFSTVLLDNTGQKFSYWRNISANYQRIKQWVNATGSKLKRQVFTSSGTWTCPTTLLAMSIFAVGGGGGGGGNATGGGPGGGGGEIECVNVASGSLPGTNQSVTIGSGGSGGTNGTSGNNTTVGSLITASGGAGGNISGGPGAGGGATANGGYLSFTDWEDPLNAAFQCVNAAQVGGTGGSAGGTSSTFGYPGQDGLPGTGGNPMYDTPDTASTGGRAYGGGGGGASDGTGLNGGSASANTGGGGGGSDTLTGGNGGSGIAVVYWLEG